MPSVIADTSPLQYLHQIGCLGLLADLFQRVIVPDGVAQEIQRGRCKDETGIAFGTKRTSLRKAV